MKRFTYLLMFMLLMTSAFAATPNPGHDASRIGPGTFPEGNFAFNGSINISNTSASLYTPRICLNGDCQTSWPAGGGGGWTNTSVQTSTSLNVSVDSGTLFVDSTNNRIGIGTTYPSVPLAVNTTGVTDIRLDYGSANYGRIQFGNDAVILTNGPTASGAQTMLLSAAGDIQLAPGNSETVYILASNKYVGMGTSQPKTPLHISTGNYNALTIDKTVGSPRGNFTIGVAESAANEFYIKDNNASVKRILVSGTGDVGINDTTPSYTLDVGGVVQAQTSLVTPQVCLGGDCRTTWPSIVGISSAGGWTNTSTVTTTGLSVNATGTLFAGSTITGASGLTIQSGTVSLPNNEIGDAELADAHTISGGTISSNSVSGTWTTTGTLTIGDNGDNIVMDANNWDVSSAGAGTFTGLTSNGVVNVVTTTNDSASAHALEVQGSFIRIGDGSGNLLMANGVGIKFHDSGIAHASIKYATASDRMDFCGSSSNSVLSCTGTPTLSLLSLNSNPGLVGIGDSTPTNTLDVAGTIGISDTTVIDASRNLVNIGTINTGSGAMELGDAAVANGDTNSIPTGDQVYDFVTGQGYITVDDDTPDSDAEVPDAITVSAGTLGSNTISSGATFTTAGTWTLGDNGDAVVISATNWDVDASGNANLAGYLAVPATGRVYLDGASNTYIYEPVADTIQFVRGGTLSVTLDSGGLKSDSNVYVGHAASNDDDYVYFDQGTESIRWEEANTWFEISDEIRTGSPVQGQLFEDNDNVAYYIDPASSSTAASINGNVGIGTTGPDRKLHVAGSEKIASGSSDRVTNGNFAANANSWTDSDEPGGVMTWSSANGGCLDINGQVGYSNADQQLTTIAGTTYVATVRGYGLTNGPFLFYIGTSQGNNDLLSESISSTGLQVYTFTATSTTTWVRLRSGWSNNCVDDVSVQPVGLYVEGRVGIGDSTPDSKLDIVNTASADDVLELEDSSGVCEAQPSTTGLTWSCSSDERLKKDITPAQPMLDYLISMPLYNYTVIKTNEHVMGPVAQRMQAVHPELVTQGGDGMLRVSEVNSWQLVKGIQELNSKIENSNTQALEARIAALERELASQNRTNNVKQQGNDVVILLGGAQQ